MFSLSPSELLTIGVVALIVFGPRRLPEIARRAGQMVSYLKSAAAEIRREVDPELDSIAKPFREAAGDLAAAGKGVAESAEGELKWVDEVVDDMATPPAASTETPPETSNEPEQTP